MSGENTASGSAAKLGVVGRRDPKIVGLPNRLATYAIIAYQHSLSLLLGPRCRFYPSCSAYAKECFQRYDFVTALAKSVRRLACCHPFHPGGIDLP